MRLRGERDLLSGPVRVGRVEASGGRGPLLLAAGAALWGTTGTSQSFLAGAVPPAAVGALRVLVGGLALTLVALPGLRAAAPRLRAARGPLLAASIATAAYQPAFFAGVRDAGIAVGTIVTVGAAPFLAGLIAAVLGDHRPNRRWAATTAVAVAGLVLLVLPTADGAAPGVRGVAAALVAALAFATYTVAAKRLLVRGVPRLAAVAATFLMAGLLLGPVLIVSLPGAEAPGRLLEPSGLAVVAWLGLGATAASYLLFTAGLRTTPAVTGATMALVEPLTATALGVLVLGERLGPVGVAGAGLVGLALTVGARLPERDRSAPSTSARDADPRDARR